MKENNNTTIVYITSLVCLIVSVGDIEEILRFTHTLMHDSLDSLFLIPWLRFVVKLFFKLFFV